MKTAAFLGDSITFGSCLTDPTKRFSTLICAAYGWNEKNCGIPGTLLAKAGSCRKEGNSFVDRMSLILDADVAFVFGGTNDYFWSDRPIIPPDNETDNSYFVNALKEICCYIIQNRSDHITFLMTPYPHNGIGNYSGGATYQTSNEHPTDQLNFNGQRLSDYVTAILAAGNEYGIPVIDLYHAGGFDYRTMTIDGCHPNEIGHQWIADIIDDQMKTIL